MDVKELAEKLTPDKFKSPYNRWATHIGAENLLKLIEHEGGKPIHLPTLHTLMKEVIKQRIVAEYAAGEVTIQTLADKYDLSKNTIQSYISESKAKARRE